MKRIISTLTAVLMLFCLSVTANAVIYPDEYPDFAFESDLNDTYSVADYSGTGEEVHIPEYVYSRLVQRIDTKAFYNKAAVVKLYMHDNITNVRDWGVRGCSNLEYIYYSKKLLNISEHAFSYNQKLCDALLKNTSVQDIITSAYTNDKALKRIALPSSLTSIGNSVFSGTAARCIVIPSGVTSIGKSCFANNASLKKVYIPESVTSIGATLFNKSPNVTVYTTQGSAAAQYCATNSINCEIIGAMPSEIDGDVNFDGRLDENDAYTMRSELNNEDVDFNSQNCDMNSDCRFDVNDVTALQNKLTQTYTVIYNYKSYSSAEAYENVSRTVSATTYKSDAREIANENYPSIKSPYVTYAIESVSKNGNTISVNISDSPKYYTVSFNGKESHYRYNEPATLTADEESYFITGGRPVARGTSYTFFVTGNADYTTDTSVSGDREDIVSIDFNSYIITDERITIDLLATADVSSFKRMGVAFALTSKDRESLAEAIGQVTGGTDVYNEIAVHNSGVTTANISGQYQFIYEPFLKLADIGTKERICFYTFAETAEGEIIVSDVADVKISSVLA